MGKENQHENIQSLSEGSHQSEAHSEMVRLIYLISYYFSVLNTIQEGSKQLTLQI